MTDFVAFSSSPARPSTSVAYWRMVTGRYPRYNTSSAPMETVPKCREDRRPRRTPAPRKPSRRPSPARSAGGGRPPGDRPRPRTGGFLPWRRGPGRRYRSCRRQSWPRHRCSRSQARDCRRTRPSPECPRQKPDAGEIVVPGDNVVDDAGARRRQSTTPEPSLSAMVLLIRNRVELIAPMPAAPPPPLAVTFRAMTLLVTRASR